VRNPPSNALNGTQADRPLRQQRHSRAAPERPYRVSEGPGMGTQFVRLIRPQSLSLFLSDMLSVSQMPQPTMNDSTRKASRFMNIRCGSVASG
jgi:hypothetical protein